MGAEEEGARAERGLGRGLHVLQADPASKLLDELASDSHLHLSVLLSIINYQLMLITNNNNNKNSLLYMLLLEHIIIIYIYFI